MSRRIDIELTSAQPDGSWTWRAAGALQPRGAMDGALLHSGAKVGDVVRAEADFEIDGISIISVLPPRARHRTEPERIELLEPRHAAPGVTTQLAGRPDGRRPRDGRRPSRDDVRGGRPDRPGGPRREREDTARREGRREDTARREGRREDTARREGRREDTARREGQGRDRTDTRRSEERQPGEGERPRARRERSGPARREAPPAKRTKRRLNPANTHRRAVLDSLPPEQRPVAEQVLRGGIPAVRTAIHLEREKANAEGRPAPQAEELVTLAESLLPRLKAAEWRDRAEAVSKAVDEVALRDLRSVVVGADLARDDETRELAAGLRASLERRLTAGREEWEADIGRHLDEGRVARALRSAGRPPEVSARLSAELAARLTEAARAALSPQTPPDRWISVLEAVVASPVRRNVKPLGLPADPGPALLAAARQQVGRVPALAAMLGVSMPPPPGPSRPGTMPRRPPRPPARRRPEPSAPAPAEESPTDAGAPPLAEPDLAAPSAPAEESPTEASASPAQLPEASAPAEPIPETDREPADAEPPASDGGSA